MGNLPSIQLVDLAWQDSRNNPHFLAPSGYRELPSDIEPDSESGDELGDISDVDQVDNDAMG